MFLQEAWFLTDPAADPAQLPAQGWRRVQLPHQWSLEGIAAEAGWYRLELPQGKGRSWARILADYTCEAWLDGVSLGRHEGYFEPWALELPRGGSLLLRVAAPYEEVGSVWPRFKRQIKGVFGQHDCRPGGSSARGQERGTGGLWGGVDVWSAGLATLLHMTWRAVEVAGGWKLLLLLELASLDARAEPLVLRLLPDNFQGESYQTERVLNLPPGRYNDALVWELPDLPRWDVWERGFPHVYRLEATLAGETLHTTVGFRTLGQEGDWLTLNGRRLFLRGTNIIPTQWLAAYTAEQAQRDTRLLREANLNAARVHAHLTHPAFYEACDREGILVWQDFPLQWGYASDESFVQEAVRQIQAMVKHYACHPSIYLWCAHNEPTHSRRTLDPLLSQALRQADTTRIVKEASDFREHPYPGWYWGHLRDFLAIPGAPLPSEFGAQALPRAELLRQMLGEAAWPPRWEDWAYHNFQPDQTFNVAGVAIGDSLERFVQNSQDYQARLLRFAIEAYRRAKGQVTGYFQFMFVEPWEGITWAALELDRTPKAGYTAIKEASNPLLLSLVPFRETLTVGQQPLMEVWLINDLERMITARVALRLEGAVSVSLAEETVAIQPQEARRLFVLGEAWEAPPGAQSGLGALADAVIQAPPGSYRIVGEVWEGTLLRSTSELPIRYLEPQTPAEQGW